MALGVGSAATVFVDVEGDLSKFRNDVAGAGDVAAKELGGGKMQRAGKVAGAALVAGAGAALVGGATAFVDFERGMNEVFTLIPDAGQDAYDDLTAQTKAFAAEFGVLPDVVIPSLYDSLSAGVPRDNVFGFLEESNKLAKAGATDLSTSVDALTSVVNAYGAENISAAEASDLIFSTVKAGKTTVDELGSSLFQVTPIAASLGVGFDQVSASMATLTSVTGNTSVASTQLKALLAELGKDGSKSFKAFEEAAGKTFPDFIEEGGSVGHALRIMDGLAKENDQTLGDLFGSVEAGQAALTLVADDANVFSTNLEAMGGAAGATDEAFARMEQGIGPSLDKLKARFAVVSIELGTALAPTLETIGLLVADFAGFLAKLPGPVLAGIVGFTALAGSLLVLAGPILKATQLVKGFFALMSANPYVLIAAATIAIAVVIYKNWDHISAFLSEAWSAIVGALTTAWNRVKIVTETVWNAISGFFSRWWPYLIGIFLGPIGILAALIYDNWNAIKATTETVWNAVTGFLGGVLATIQGLFDIHVRAPIEFLIGLFQALPGAAETAWNGVKGAIEAVAGWIKTKLDEIGAAADRALGPIDEIIGAGAKLGGGLVGGAGRLLGFDNGGVVPGPRGAPRLVLAHGGETFVPTHKDPNALDRLGGGGVVVNMNATISSTLDIENVARELGRRIERERRAQGRRN